MILPTANRWQCRRAPKERPSNPPPGRHRPDDGSFPDYRTVGTALPRTFALREVRDFLLLPCVFLFVHHETVHRAAISASSATVPLSSSSRQASASPLVSIARALSVACSASRMAPFGPSRDFSVELANEVVHRRRSYSASGAPIIARFIRAALALKLPATRENNRTIPCRHPWLSQFCKRYVYYPTVVASCKDTVAELRVSAGQAKRGQQSHHAFPHQSAEPAGRPGQRIAGPRRQIGPGIKGIQRNSGHRLQCEESGDPRPARHA